MIYPSLSFHFPSFPFTLKQTAVQRSYPRNTETPVTHAVDPSTSVDHDDALALSFCALDSFAF